MLCKFHEGRKGLPPMGSNADLNKEEKSLPHVAMVAKFLDDSNPKIHLKSTFALFQTLCSLILFNFL